MKGIILAGGLGTRLYPLTRITNKHLLPVYNKPMILYPLETLRDSGVDEIMIVCGREHGGHFMNFLGSGEDFGVRLSYGLQSGAGGIAAALSLAENFADQHRVAVILGDNIFENNFKKEIAEFGDLSRPGAKVFLKEVEDPSRFGVPEIHGGKIAAIEEKPKTPKSKYAVVGCYLYSPDVFTKIKTLKPSDRGELEITDVHNKYIAEGALTFGVVDGFWSDAGTFDSLMKTAIWISERSGTK